MATEKDWKKWEKALAKWNAEELIPWQKANPGKDWIAELYNQQSGGVTPQTHGGLHPPPPPPIP